MLENKTIKCLVVDDEPPAREIIRRYIEQVPVLELAGECANAIQAFTFLQQQPVDLLFLETTNTSWSGRREQDTGDRIPELSLQLGAAEVRGIREQR